MRSIVRHVEQVRSAGIDANRAELAIDVLRQLARCIDPFRLDVDADDIGAVESKPVQVGSYATPHLQHAQARPVQLDDVGQAAIIAFPEVRRRLRVEVLGVVLTKGNVAVARSLDAPGKE